MQSGFLLVDKPVDWTSHDVVGYIRSFIRKLGLSVIHKLKVGHAGTLDPFATGLLIVGIGREATKRIDEFKNMPKEYVATIRLGAVSDTYDRTGTIQESKKARKQISETDVRTVLKNFVGKQQQVPPMYSAKKVGGKKLYELARKGIEIEREPSEIEIFDIELITPPLLGEAGRGSSQTEKLSSDHEPPPTPSTRERAFTIRVSCSTGTYIRTLAHDIGQKLRTGAYCEELRRTKIGEYRVEDAIQPEDITRAMVCSL